MTAPPVIGAISDTHASNSPAPNTFDAVSATYGAGSMADPYPLYAAARCDEPVMQGDILARFGIPSQADYANVGRQVFTVFRHSDVEAVLGDDATWSSDLLADGLGQFLGEMFLSARDGPSHRQLRGLLQTCFAPDALRRWKEKLIVPLIERHYGERIRALGRAELMQDIALPFPIHAIYTVLGFPDDPAAMARFADQALRILNGPQIEPAKAETAMAGAFAAAAELDESVKAIVQQKRAAGATGDTMIERLIQAELNGERFTDEQIAGIVRMMLPAAAETTTRTVANLFTLLFENPAMLDRVRADRGLLGKVITETMRLEPVAGFLARRATRDTELGGVAIPEGAAVSLVIGSANRDETVFENPDAFDIDRPFRRSFGFGHGVHMCLGMPIAKLELEAIGNFLLDLPGLRLDPDHPPPVISGLQFRSPGAVHMVWNVT